MTLEGKRIGFGLTASHSTYHKVFPQIEKLVAEKADRGRRGYNIRSRSFRRSLYRWA